MSLLSSVGIFFENVYNFIVHKHGEELVDKTVGLVKAVVNLLEQPNLSGQEKREKALTIITTALQHAGIEIGESIIRTLIETAVQDLKNKQQ